MSDNDKRTPQVSVCVGAYNAERFIEKNMESIMAQTMRDIEIICVDDGSRDKTLDILMDYAARDERIRVYTQENQGAGAARNRALDEASGEYVMVLDADDYFREDMLEIMLGEARLHGTDVMVCGGLRFDTDSGRILGPFAFADETLLPGLGARVFSPRDIPDRILQFTGAWAWNKLIRRDFLVRNGIRFQNIPIIDDGYFSAMVLTLSERIGWTKEQLTFYRENNPDSQMGSSQTGQVPILAHQFYEAAEKIISEMRKRGIYDLYKKSVDEWVMLHFWVAIDERCGDYETYRYTYDRVKEYAETLGVFDRVERDGYESYPHGGLFRRIREQSCDEFLFGLYMHWKGQESSSFRFSFPEHSVKTEERVLLYGAGAVGREYYAQNLMHSYCRIVGWTDKESARLKTEGMPVTAIDDAVDIDFDAVLIAIDSKAVALGVREMLIGMGISDDRIRWREKL